MYVVVSFDKRESVQICTGNRIFEFTKIKEKEKKTEKKNKQMKTWNVPQRVECERQRYVEKMRRVQSVMVL